jgi:peptide/nickel transport system permease protein
MIRAAALRLAASAASLALLAVAVFAVLHATPGGPAYAILGLKASPAAVEALDRAAGLNQPVWRQFLIWCAHLLHGQLGVSYMLNRDVAALICDYGANSLLLYAAGLTAAALLGLGAGLLHGIFWGRAAGRAVGALEIGFYAMPGFFVATMLLAAFSVWLGWLPASGIADLRLPQPGAMDYLRHLILPAASVALTGFAPLSRYFASSVRQELAAEYARAAAARGLGQTAILLRHVTRNALRPFVTMLGLSFPAMLSSMLVIETVFGYPGLGWLLWRSAIRQDYPVVMGVVLITGLMTVTANLAADIAGSWLDPRLR